MRSKTMKRHNKGKSMKHPRKGKGKSMKHHKKTKKHHKRKVQRGGMFSFLTDAFVPLILTGSVMKLKKKGKKEKKEKK